MRTYAAFKHGRQVTVKEATLLSHAWFREMERFASMCSQEHRNRVELYVNAFLARMNKEARGAIRGR